MKRTMENTIGQYYEIWRETNVLYMEWAKKRQISYYELLVMLSVSQSDEPCTQKMICEQWILPKQTANTILQNFLKRGWVKFEPMEDDRRNKQITVTPEGKQFIHRTADELWEHERRVWEKLGRERSMTLLENTALYNQYFKETDRDGAV